MEHADEPEVGKLEDVVHDPHEVGQHARARVPRGHEDRDVRSALVVGQHQGPASGAGGRLVPALDYCRTHQSVRPEFSAYPHIWAVVR